MMVDVDGTLIMNILQRMQADMADLKQDMREVKLRMTILEGHHASVMASLHLLQEQNDRSREDMRQVKRRPELVDAD
jgi:predicted  nucleic acid-binding Zn-ribbon protein